MNEFAASLQKFPVTVATCLLAVAATLAWWAGGGVDGYAMQDSFWAGEAWRPVTTALPHANIFHLLFNVYWTWRFGALIEEEFGPARTAALFLGFTAATSLCSHAVMEDGIGLSGLGYALFGLVWTLRRRDTRFIGAIDDGTVFLFVGWFFLCILLTWARIMNIANFAHFFGAVFGVLAGRSIGNVSRHRKAFASAAIALALAGAAGSFSRGSEFAMERGLSTSAFHPVLKAKVLSVEGRSALARGDSDAAERLLLRAARIDPLEPETLLALGKALDSNGKASDAFQAYIAAADLADAGLAGGRDMHPAYRFVAKYYFDRANWAGAARYAKKMLDLRGNDASAWHLLGLSLEKTGDIDRAVRAFRRASSLDPSNADYGKSLERATAADPPVETGSEQDK